jgi:hypothetical protein
LQLSSLSIILYPDSLAVKAEIPTEEMATTTTGVEGMDDVNLVNGPIPGSSANEAPIRSYKTAWLYPFDWYPSHYTNWT